MFGKTWVCTLVVTALVVLMGTEGVRYRGANSRVSQRKSPSTKDLPQSGQNLRMLEQLTARVGRVEATVGRISRTMGQIGLKMKETESRDLPDRNAFRDLMERFDRVSNRVANLDEWRSRQDRGESNNGDAVGQSEDDADEDLSMRRPMILPSEEGGDRLFPADGRLRSADDGEAPDRPRPNTGSGGLPLRERLGAGDNDGTDDVDGPRPNRPRAPFLRPNAGPRRRPNPEGGDDDGGEQEGDLEEAEEAAEEGSEEAEEEAAEEEAEEGTEVQGYEEAEETLRESIQELGRAMRSA
ncbi:uncharacterized protein LOC144919095 [Branchiostoma floridae x Branchiostoma belcheri]